MKKKKNKTPQCFNWCLILTNPNLDMTMCGTQILAFLYSHLGLNSNSDHFDLLMGPFYYDEQCFI